MKLSLKKIVVSLCFGLSLYSTSQINAACGCGQPAPQPQIPQEEVKSPSENLCPVASECQKIMAMQDTMTDKMQAMINKGCPCNRPRPKQSEDIVPQPVQPEDEIDNQKAMDDMCTMIVEEIQAMVTRACGCNRPRPRQSDDAVLQPAQQPVQPEDEIDDQKSMENMYATMVDIINKCGCNNPPPQAQPKPQEITEPIVQNEIVETNKVVLKNNCNKVIKAIRTSSMTEKMKMMLENLMQKIKGITIFTAPRT